MPSRSRTSGASSKFAKSCFSASQQDQSSARAQAGGYPEWSSTPRTTSWEQGVNSATTTPSTDPGQLRPGGEANESHMDVDVVCLQLSTAKSHLSILHTLFLFSEYEGSLSAIRERIRAQQDKVSNLEQQLKDAMPKEKKAKFRGCLTRDKPSAS